MKVAVSNIAWSPDDDEHVARLLTTGGANAVELAPTKYWPAPCRPTAAAVEEKRQWWEDRGLEVYSMQALLFGMSTLNIFGTAAVVRDTLDYLEHIAHLGAALGAKRLVFGSPRNRDRKSLSTADAFNQAVDFFSRLSERIRGFGLKFVLEPNPTDYDCNFATTAPEARAVVTAVNSPCFKLHLDAGIMLLNHETPQEMVPFCKNELAHVHISEPWLAPLNETSLHHQSLASSLRAISYKECISIEMRSQSDIETDRFAVATALERVRDIYVVGQRDRQ